MMDIIGRKRRIGCPEKRVEIGVYPVKVISINWFVVPAPELADGLE